MTAKSLFKTPPKPQPYISTGEYLKKVAQRTPDTVFMGKSAMERAMLSCELYKARATIAAIQIVNSEVNKVR